MAPGVRTGSGAQERLQRLAVLYAVEIRLKIVAELFLREMSAKQFHREFGGGTLARVSQNFTRLQDDLWLHFVREEGAGGNRRGGVERFYRATEPPFIDLDSWKLLPYSVRFTSSVNLFRQVVPRLRDDMAAWSKGNRRARELTCETLSLDVEGHDRAARAVHAEFEFLYQEQENAYRRAMHSGEQLSRVDVLLLSFESPTAVSVGADDGLLISKAEPFPFPARLAPILGDIPYRNILSALNEREMSPTEYHREVGEPSEPCIRRRFDGLMK